MKRKPESEKAAKLEIYQKTILIFNKNRFYNFNIKKNDFNNFNILQK